MLSRQQKEDLVDNLKDKFSRANAAFLAEYRGLKVEDMTKLRSDVRKSQGEVKVIKNRIAKIAAKGSPFEEFSKDFQGPLLVAFSYEDPVAVAKAVKDNISKESPLNLTSGAMDGQLLNAAQVDALSQLPDRDTLLSMMLSALSGPARGFATVLNALPQGLHTTLTAIKEQKEKQA